MSSQSIQSFKDREPEGTGKVRNKTIKDAAPDEVNEMSTDTARSISSSSADKKEAAAVVSKDPEYAQLLGKISKEFAKIKDEVEDRNLEIATLKQAIATLRDRSGVEVEPKLRQEILDAIDQKYTQMNTVLSHKDKLYQRIDKLLIEAELQEEPPRPKKLPKNDVELPYL